MSTDTGKQSGSALSADQDDDDAGQEREASLVDALLVYAEPLAAGAHAIVVGDAETGVADRLLDLGARGVHVYDPDPARAANAARTAPRGVTIRPLVDELDVRDGAFDLAVVPDLADVNDPRTTIDRLRRAVAATGAVIVMGRAKTAGAGGAPPSSDEDPPFGAELGPAVLEYSELYDLFAVQFDEVSIAGVVPFRGVVFAELGGDDEAPAVSVDTRLASPDPPSVFVVVAGQLSTTGHGSQAEGPLLDPYSIVQISSFDDGPAQPREETLALEAALASAQLKAELLSTQLEETRDRLVVADVRSVEAATRLERTTTERDAALTRAMELEAVLAASQQTMATLERRLLEAEQGMLERDDRIAALSAELDARRSQELVIIAPPAEPAPTVDVDALVTRAERAEAALALAVAEMAAREENAATYADTRMPDITSIVARAERAEAALALNVADLAHITEAHAQETKSYEEQLRERARFIASLEKELVRREQLVKELVHANAELLEAMHGTEGESAPAVKFEAAPPISLPDPAAPTKVYGNGNGNGQQHAAADAHALAAREAALAASTEEIASLRSKLDALASEIARREGELEARGWRITELENLLQRKLDDAAAARAAMSAATAPTQQPSKELPHQAQPASDLVSKLARAEDELDALRKALTQEHSARVAAESGEELTRARAELARQATLLEQVRARTE